MRETPDGDTIGAIATPPGRGALGVIRLSGPEAGRVLGRLAPELKGTLPEPRKARLLALHHPGSGERLDRGVVTWFPGPASYTGEDSVELSVHGGLVPPLVLEACLAAGVREARAGEFTQRAYLNGKLDLVQAEAVRDLVDARTERQRRAALHQTEGGLSRRLVDLRQRLVHLEALLVHHVDFPDEDEPPVPVARILAEGKEVGRRLDGLLATAPEGALLREGALTVFAGRPNAGKSSLFNALLGEARAIVTEVPGTTRDAVEAAVSLRGFPFRLVDTAGIRGEAEVVEALGIEVARRYLENADVLVLCARADGGWGGVEREFLREAREGACVLVVRTMLDRVESDRDEGVGEVDRETVARVGEENVIGVSTVDGRGLDRVRERLTAMVFRGLVGREGAEPLITHRRQREALERAREEVGAFECALQEGVPAEMAGAHLHGAKTALERLLGVISGDEVLDVVFSEFCIGK